MTCALTAELPDVDPKEAGLDDRTIEDTSAPSVRVVLNRFSEPGGWRQ